MIKVIIADDHALVREGIKRVLKEESDLEVVAEAKNAAEVLEFLRKEHADALILDISMPGMSGLDLLKDIKRLRKPPQVLMLSMLPEQQFAVRALKCGASGYLMKDSLVEDLPRAIRKIASGGKFITPCLAELLAYEMSRGVEELPHEKLSEREFEVFLKLASGKTVGAIADELSLSVATISTYRSRVLEKFGFKTNADLTQYAYRYHLLT